MGGGLSPCAQQRGVASPHVLSKVLRRGTALALIDEDGFAVSVMARHPAHAILSAERGVLFPPLSRLRVRPRRHPLELERLPAMPTAKYVMERSQVMLQVTADEVATDQPLLQRITASAP